ncbi:hypothetical protein TFLX_03101 [Thermoflexales bacterium]|nr:hypothetical protein TFLX_03101 [Thermoflexales bacterium]
MTMNEPGFVVRLAIVLALEVVCGVLYNRWVAQHQASNEGIYTAFYMVGGVMLTLLIGILLVGFTAVMLMLVLFAASGMPMVLGSMQRHTERIKTTNEKSIAEALELLNGTQSEK